MANISQIKLNNNDYSLRDGTVIQTTGTLASANWSSGSQTITVNGVTASNLVIVSPAPASVEAYGNARIYCAAQSANSLTFACPGTAPSTDLTVNIVIW